MIIPLVNLRRQHEELCDPIRDAIDGVIERGDFILGSEVEDFEREFAAFCETKHCIGVASGLDALTLAMKGLGIGPGDQVITAGNTFVATVLAIKQTGAVPVLVDTDPDDYTILPERIEAAITPKTKVVLPVHLYGKTANMPAIQAIARTHSLKILEDACQTIGASDLGKYGDVAALSFNPFK
ncbi:MAG: aminotransferase class V-fold PLP-dependent enzyme, partial [Planctomycetes bacterium]|nr:aminotransferase class V-fold PLP-dependent enzyme [Planctomycetota bacterium]